MDPATVTAQSDHACWGYSSDAERAAVAVRWLGDGLRIGQRAIYVGEGQAERLIAELADLPEALTALENGALVVHSVEEIYDLSAPIDATAQLALYNAVVSQAVADGYQGLRVAADMTALLEDDAQRDAHLRWEHIADRYMTTHPVAAVCMYDRRRVSGVEAIACAHPLRGPAEPLFGLYGGGPSRAVLQGEIDACSSEIFADVLRELPSTDCVIDLTRLSFIDARSAWLLQDELTRRRSRGQQIHLAEAPEMLQQIWRICDFDRSLLATA
jgi:anti-anti-sigma factor